jgi:hypothetical protein
MERRPGKGKTTGVERHMVELTVDSIVTRLEINEAPVRNLNGKDYTEAARAVCRSADGFLLILPLAEASNVRSLVKQLIQDVSESYMYIGT